MSIFAPILGAFRRIPHARRIDDALYQTNKDLLEAEAAFEEIEARRDCLRRRKDRLMSELHLHQYKEKHQCEPLPISQLRSRPLP